MACNSSAHPLIFGKDGDNIPNKFVEANAISLGTVTANLFVSSGDSGDVNIATLFDTLVTEDVQDVAGPLVATGGTKTGITVTYQDSTGDIDFVVTDTTVAGDSGSNQGITPGDTFTIEGGTNVATVMTTDKVTINATDTNTTYSIQDGELSQNNFTNADHTKLNAIEAAADVTDATNVNAAGALMLSDSTTAGLGIVIDEDNMATDSATKVPTQQSVKAYVDDKTLAAETHGDGETLDFGTGSDSKISFDGTDTVWNPRATGTGNLIVSGEAQVGIGQPDPEASLHVSGDELVVAVFENNTASAAIAVASTSTSAIITASSTDTTITNTGAGNIHFMTNEDYVVTLENGGKVGIGTTDPGQLLDVVNADTGAVGARVESKSDASTGNDARFIAKVAGAGGGDPHIRFMINGGQSWCVGLANAASDNFRIADANNLDSGIAMEINTSQNVWIPQSLAVGQSAVADNTAIFECDSTTKSFLPPRMTTTQRDAISSPATGSLIYNLTTNVLNFYNGSAWGAV